MSDFKELKEPQHGVGGWYVATKNGVVAWLTVNGDISRDTSKSNLHLIYHNSEADAYHALVKYYNSHGLMWLGNSAAAPVEKIENIPIEDEQQVMKFT